jgi:hypothetical protein
VMKREICCLRCGAWWRKTAELYPEETVKIVSSSDANGDLRVSKRRKRPGRPALAVVEKPEKK